MKLIIASNNEHKIREIQEILGSKFEEVLSMKDAGINVNVVENGKTFLENARKKATEIADALPKGGYAVLADDSGLSVDALHGDPGVYSARYAGEGHDDNANNKKLLEAMQGVPYMDRGCEFVCAMVLVRSGMKNIEVEGRYRGVLMTEAVGQNGFGYDPLFFSEEYGKTFAQLTPDQKNAISHRKRALEAVLKELEA